MSQKKDTLGRLTQAELFGRVGEICAAVNVVTDTQELLNCSLIQVLNLFGAMRGSIFIISENGSDLILRSSVGLGLDEKNEIIKRMGEGIVGRVAETKQPIFVDDIHSDDRFLNYKKNEKYNTPSFICSPLLIKDQVIGVINITDKGCGSHFSKDELQLLDFISSQVALNYKRIKLYKKFKNILNESKILKYELGKTSEETNQLKKQVVLHEKLATIGKLAGGIAHEFNNPLDGVMRYTNLCLENVKDDDVARGYLMEIKGGLKRMANIVKSLLACSRNTVSSSAQQEIDVNVAVDQALQALTDDLVHKNVVVSKIFSDDLPGIIDLGIEGVITNVVRNAIDAIENDGKIVIKTFKEEESILIEVQDNGVGIDREKTQQIFEPFFTTKDIEKGCGLGLTIVSEIIKAYGGSISVDSSCGEGAVFKIRIPVKQ